MGLIDGLVSGIGGLISAGADRRMQKEQFAQTMEFNKAEAAANREFQTSEREAAQQWNLEQWNRENEYNSPVEQMKRAIAAGINPNAVAGSIGGAGSQAGQVRTSGQSGAQASVSQPPMPTSYSSAISNIAQSLNTIWQNDKVRSETEGQNIANKYADERNRVEINKLNAETKKQIASADLDREQRQNVRQMTRALKLKTPLEVKQLEIAYQAVQQEIRNARATESKINEETREIGARADLNVAQTKNVDASTENLNKEGKILDEKLIYENAIAEAAKAGVIIGMNDLQTLNLLQSKGVDVNQYLQNIYMLNEINALTEKDLDTWSTLNRINEDSQKTVSFWDLPSQWMNKLNNQVVDGVLRRRLGITDNDPRDVFFLDGVPHRFIQGKLLPYDEWPDSYKNKKNKKNKNSEVQREYNSTERVINLR